jgi:hypothetical protein
MSRLVRIISILMLNVSAYFFVGCHLVDLGKQTTPPIKTDSPPVVSIYPSTPSATALPTITDTAIPDTPTHTVGPSSTPTRTATWTPVPTLSEEVRKENLIDLFTTNGDCQYPCFWGVRPGEPFSKVFTLASYLGESPSLYENQYSYHISLDEFNFPDFDVVFIEKNGLVEKITARLAEAVRHPDYMEAFNMSLSLSSMMTRYGQPDHVLLQIQPRAEKDSPIGYRLYLLYIREGFAVWYDGVVNSEDPIRVCVFLEDYHLEDSGLELQDSMEMETLQEELLKKGFLPIDEVTSMSSEDFYRIFSSKENRQCIETTIDHWQ